MRKVNYKEQGITLVALVITIIILLILTGVTISSALGENGLFKVAKKSAEEYKNSEMKESEELAKFEEEFDNIEELGGILINNEEELIKFREEVNRGNSYEGKTIYLKSDIELKEESNWEPIGNDSNPFKGIFDGRNKKITNLTGTYSDTSQRNVGLFGNVNNATIRNVNVEGTITVNSAIESAGGIVGKANGSTKVEKCNNNISITSTGTKVLVGGIIAKAEINSQVTVNNCTNNVELNGEWTIGGCIGVVDNSNVEINNFVNYKTIISEKGTVGGCLGSTGISSTRCNSTVKIINTKNLCEEVRAKGEVIGGIVGLGWGATNLIICNSYNTSNVISETREAGGIIGDTDAITYCINVYNEGVIEANKSEGNDLTGSVGGIIGSSYGLDAEIKVINAYNTGKLVTQNYGCGILGVRNRVINNSYIKNVYNIGVYEGETDGKYGILARRRDNAEIRFDDVSNAFFVNADSGSNMGNNIGTSKEESEIKSKEFVDTLNTFVTQYPVLEEKELIKINLSRWTLGEKGYPILEDVK